MADIAEYKSAAKTVFKFILYGFLGLILIGIIGVTFFPNEKEAVQVNEAAKATYQFPNIKSLLGKDQATVEAVLGKSNQVENFDNKYPCENSNCDKVTFGISEVFFKNGLSSRYTYMDTTNIAINDAIAAKFGFGKIKPSDKAANNLKYLTDDGYELNFFGGDKLDYLLVEMLSSAEYVRARLKKSIKEQFSYLDGSHENLTKAIKENMDDPSSYEHVETKHEIKDDHIIVYTKFRAKNVLGAKVLNEILAKVDAEGNVLEVEL